MAFIVSAKGGRAVALRKAKAIIARRNKDPRAYKGAEREVSSLKLTEAGVTLGGRPIPKGTDYIVETRLKRKKRK